MIEAGRPSAGCAAKAVAILLLYCGGGGETVRDRDVNHDASDVSLLLGKLSWCQNNAEARSFQLTALLSHGWLVPAVPERRS